MIEYRTIAREALDRAKRELEGGDLVRVRYAALEIRDALEAVTYERAALYKDQLPITLYDKWTPQELLAFLVEMDPKAELATSNAIAEQRANSSNMLKGELPDKTILTQVELKLAMIYWTLTSTLRPHHKLLPLVVGAI